jgi:hypothetical protein
MTLSELAEECRELAMRLGDTLYDRTPNREVKGEGRVEKMRRQGERRVTMYKPIKKEHWPNQQESAARKFNPETDIKVEYLRDRGEAVLDKGRVATRKKPVRKVKEIVHNGPASMQVGVKLARLRKNLLDHADKRRLHLTGDASAFGSAKIGTAKLSKSYRKGTGFKSRYNTLMPRLMPNIEQHRPGGKLVKAMGLMAGKFDPLHRPPRKLR